MFLLPLVHNEATKLLGRRRPQLVLGLLLIFLAVATWGEQRQLENQRAEAGAEAGQHDWQAQVRARIDALERGARRRRVFASVTRSQRFEAMRLTYYLNHGIDPARQTGPAFSRTFAAVGSSLLLPLLIIILGADIVTGEEASGTIKMLLTRPVARWKILAAKVVTVVLFAGLLVGAGAIAAWLIGGVAFGWRGWDAPVFTGFRSSGNGVDTTNVRLAPLWLDALGSYGLAWLSTVSVAILAVTFSVFFRSSVGAMGSLLAMLVAGTLLGQLATDWTAARWLFPTNLPLAQFHAGTPPPVDGMTVEQSAVVLVVWCSLALGAAFAVFARRDVTA
jgi:ABC-2 type transport system permease protein